MSLVSTEWLEKNLKNVRIIDASWHMPGSKKNADKEFLKIHIENTVFFDLDKYSDEESSLPHMMPDKDKWEKIVSDQGIKNSDQIIIYDDSDTISSCRCWFTFIYFGHDPNKVSILDGGLKKWINEKRFVTSNLRKFDKSKYDVTEKKFLIKNKEQISKNINTKVFELIDARSEQRFKGQASEPRKGLKSGHIPNSKNIPFTDCLNKADRTFKKKEDLIKIFAKQNIDIKKDVVFTCGSGVTACVLGLANFVISDKTPIIYDGSWSEWGKE